jgi:hypothetical protein
LSSEDTIEFLLFQTSLQCKTDIAYALANAWSKAVASIFGRAGIDCDRHKPCRDLFAIKKVIHNSTIKSSSFQAISHCIMWITLSFYFVFGVEMPWKNGMMK